MHLHRFSGGSTVADNEIAAANLSSARIVVLGCISSALGQPRQTASVRAIAAAVGADLALTQTVELALDKATQQLTSRGVSYDHVLPLVGKVRQELLDAVSDVTHATAASSLGP